MPVVFDEIDAQVVPERPSESTAPALPSGGQTATELTDRVRREVILMEARRRRLAAD
jgi:hypothetical protein